MSGAVGIVLLSLAALFGYWTYGCWSLAYCLDRNALTISWAGNQQVIPLAEVRALVPGPAAHAPQALGGVEWPGYHIGRSAVAGLPAVAGLDTPGPVLFFSTHLKPQDLLYVVTPARAYGLSVPDAAAFAQELKLRLGLGPTERLEQEVRRWFLWELPAWQDPRVIGLLALGIVSNLTLFAYAAYLMPSLEALIAMHYTPLGVVDQIGLKVELFRLPATGLVLLLLNGALGVGLHRREHCAAYLALTGAVALQVILWGATLKLLG
ncbi:MAG: hypothetical protein HY686_00330 [Chloroflexi bacterium]|nr:hypothetical protein [Chloroflexota bacterium]